jgi:hypothetical protein
MVALSLIGTPTFVRDWAETCVPLVIDGPEIRRARAALLARAKALGHDITAEADLHVIADGKRIEPDWPGNMRAAFILAAGSKSIALRSRSFIPAYISPASNDKRELGVAVSCLQIDDSQISLEDDPALAERWHQFERHDDGHRRRCTTGYTPLPSGTRLIVIDLAGRGYYWEEQEASRIALVG